MWGSASLAWFVCGTALATVFFWPYIRDIEQVAWAVHYDKCIARHELNDELLRSPLCDGGAKELAQKDKVTCQNFCRTIFDAHAQVNCDKARDENAWGTMVCTVTSRVTAHTVAEFTRHLWQSWYMAAFGVFVTYMAIRGWYDGRTEAEKHRISSNAMLEAMAMHRDYLDHGPVRGYVQNNNNIGSKQELRQEPRRRL